MSYGNNEPVPKIGVSWEEWLNSSWKKKEEEMDELRRQAEKVAQRLEQKRVDSMAAIEQVNASERPVKTANTGDALTAESRRKIWDDVVQKVADGSPITATCKQAGVPVGSYYYQRDVRAKDGKRKVRMERKRKRLAAAANKADKADKADKTAKVDKPVAAKAAKAAKKKESVAEIARVSQDAITISNLRKEIKIYRKALGFVE